MPSQNMETRATGIDSGGDARRRRRDDSAERRITNLTRHFWDNVGKDDEQLKADQKRINSDLYGTSLLVMSGALTGLASIVATPNIERAGYTAAASIIKMAAGINGIFSGYKAGKELLENLSNQAAVNRSVNALDLLRRYEQTREGALAWAESNERNAPDEASTLRGGVRETGQQLAQRLERDKANGINLPEATDAWLQMHREREAREEASAHGQ